MHDAKLLNLVGRREISPALGFRTIWIIRADQPQADPLTQSWLPISIAPVQVSDNKFSHGETRYLSHTEGPSKFRRLRYSEQYHPQPTDNSIRFVSSDDFVSHGYPAHRATLNIDDICDFVFVQKFACLHASPTTSTNDEHSLI